MDWEDILVLVERILISQQIVIKHLYIPLWIIQYSCFFIM